jgi:multidrug efflux pump subunit AcrA (membrane-fusion protein)
MTDPKEIKQWLSKKSSLPIVAGAGILLTFLIVKLQPSMTHVPQDKKPMQVNVITVNKASIKPTIIGYGNVEPDLTLQAKSEVKGRVTYVHPELKKGATLAKDTIVVKIDDKDYQLSLRQAEADLLSNQANLKEMQLTIENTELDLKLAEEKLKVRQKEFSRLEKLRKSGSISQSKLDAERQNLLQQRQEVQQLENTQTTLPSQIEVLKAKIEISKAKVQQSQRDLERTEIRTPFNARVRSVSTEQDQYVALGSSLFDISGMNKIIINAQFPVEQFKKITASFDKSKLNFDDLTNGGQMSELMSALGLESTVSIASNDGQVWDAKVERISDDIDPQSRTVGVVVSVSDSYRQIQPGVRPPLLEGNYMKVELKGAAQEFLILPRSAVHQQQIYRVNKESQLQRLNVDHIQMQGELALLTMAANSGINHGDQIVSSDVFPAVNGMRLETVLDESLQSKLVEWSETAQ